MSEQTELTRYAMRMRAAMVHAGLDVEQARDAANNSAAPICDLGLDPAETLRARLRHQRRHFGLVATDEQIEAYALAASRVKRESRPPADTRVIVRWRRDGHDDGELTWGALCEQRPDITASEGARIVLAGFLYEHEDGTTVERIS